MSRQGLRIYRTSHCDTDDCGGPVIPRVTHTMHFIHTHLIANAFTASDWIGLAGLTASLLGALLLLIFQAGRLVAGLGSTQESLRELRTDVRNLQGDVKGLQIDVKGLQIDVKILNTKVDNLEVRFDNLETRFDSIDARFGDNDALPVKSPKKPF